MTSFCITLRYLNPRQHGRGDGGEPEWPPSPLRLFQALTAAAAARWNEREQLVHAVPALQWLESLPPPTIVAPVGVPSEVRTQFYVPDNTTDLLVPAWKKGDWEKTPKRTEKVIRPTHLLGEEVHFVFTTTDKFCHWEILQAAARSITHLGWGIDVVVGDAQFWDGDSGVIPPHSSSEVWRPTASHLGTPLRTPVTGTLAALMTRHNHFLRRITPDGFHPVPPLTAFRIVHYRRETDPPSRPIAAFSLLKTDASGFRPFSITRHACTVAAMLRHATAAAAAAAQWSEHDRATIALGHGEERGAEKHQPVGPRRFAYLPLPSLEYRGGDSANVVGAIRRVLITSFADGLESQIAGTRRALAGSELTPVGSREAIAFLGSLPTTDKTVQRYLRDSTTWTSVTPVVLPGYDDPGHVRRRLKQVTDAAEKRRLLEKLDARVDSLLRKAILQAGFSKTLAAHAEVEWRDVAYLPGADLASRYHVPNHLRKHSRLHVRLRWRDAAGQPVAIPGPICLGGGRYGGIGLMVSVDENRT